jgi:hypothetical protein
MKKITTTIAVTSCMLFSTVTFARENITSSSPNPPHGQPAKLTAVCSQTTAIKDLNINNVRARVLVGGDMWWDQGLGLAQYEVPIGSGKTSLYAGAIWVGGLDAGGNIKAAGQTYRQTGTVGCPGGGNDLFAGPIDIFNFSITQERCNQFDRHWKIRKQDVIKYKDDPDFDAATADEIESKQNILSWPGNGLPNEDHFLAPFADLNGDGIYDPSSGEYPRYLIPRSDLNPPYDLDYPISPNAPKTICNDYLFGDQTIWWVFNDVGGIKYESNCPPIGLEIRAQAFAFKTNDEINNMTFYKYQIINRSSTTFSDTYFGQWVDADLGYYQDDYVRCNVKLGVGFTYNGDAIDDLPDGYGATPPAIGIDFFQGPVADVGDTLDNDRDGCFNCTYFIDPATHDTTVVSDSIFPESIIMSKFVYFNNNDNPVYGNPCGAQDHYNYLKGLWRTGEPMTYGGNGYNPGSTKLCDFMFPGTTDSKYFPTDGEWSEETLGNAVDDRRMLQSAGPFTLLPGAVNYITIGAVWARAASGDNLASIPLVEQADIKAQALFDNCFKTLDGPDAPKLVIRELDKEFIFSLQNTDNINVERYDVADPTIVDSAAIANKTNTFKFQGYQVYQLRTATGSIADLVNSPDDIKLLFQCDIKDGINQIVNYEIAPYGVYTATPEVNGADNGITHTFKVDKDLFAVGNTQLVNHKNYYYTVISYAYNNYKTFKPDSVFLGGQLKPYLAGRNNIKVYNAIPHFIDPENGGTVLNSNFGDGPSITRIEGQGNGGMILDFTSATVSEILSQSRSLHPSYVNGKGPIDVKVYDPASIQARSFTNRFNGVDDVSRWTMIENGSGTVVVEDTTISQIYEQVLATDHKQKGPDGKDLVLNWGLTANIHTVIEAGKTGAVNNGFLEGTISYSDNSARWLNFLSNLPGDPFKNWIRSTAANKDPDKVYENVIDGTWAPLKVTTTSSPPGSTIIDSLMPKPSGNWLIDAQISLSPSPGGNPSNVGISSVDIVFTSDKSKWSRAAVIEMGQSRSFTIDSAFKFDLRRSPSIDKDGNMNFPSNDNNDASTGMGWFPGYALNLETGERLNIVYGENSQLSVIMTVVDTAFGNGSEITYITQTPHKFNQGESVRIIGADALLYNAVSATITSVPNEKTFKISGTATATDTLFNFPTAFVRRGNVENGSDMRWNPTSNAYNSAGQAVFGGQHYIYVFGHNFLDGTGVPLYDGCKYIHDKMLLAADTSNTTAGYNIRKALWKEGMWVSIPMLEKGYTVSQSDVTIRLRVAKTYNRYNTNAEVSTYLNGSGTLISGTQYYVVSGTAVYNTISYAAGSTFTAQDPILSFSGGVIAPTQNGGNPMYDFNTNDLAASFGNAEAAKDALKLVNVVPNPYYAYSAYEGTTGVSGQLDNRIKIVNLPPKCTITVFTLHGTLVKRFVRDVPSDNSLGNDISTGNSETAVDWDLKNTDGIAIASGIYLIHVDAGELGKRTLKWFGVMRPIDIGVY